MSREIKFRAWDNAKKEWLNKGDAEDLIIRLDGSYEIDRGWAIVKTDLTIEQYTGLKDKNGKEIYEGDIVRVSYGYNYEVRQFKSGAWRIGRDDLCVWADSSEVIGNIHENPELLEGEK